MRELFEIAELGGTPCIYQQLMVIPHNNPDDGNRAVFGNISF
jgi:hypothetical protein